MANSAPTLNTYMSDMIAVETELLQPVRMQSEDAAIISWPEVHTLISDIQTTATAHVEDLQRRLDSLGGHAGLGLKSGIATALGAVASVIDNVRKTEVSKDLRDDYTALSLACISYGMLHTTALAQQDSATAALAKKHLVAYGALVMRINDTMPSVVLHELSEEGVVADASMSEQIQQSLEDAWNQSVAKVRGSAVHS